MAGNGKQILVKFSDGLEEVYDSIRQAALALDISRDTIAAALNKKVSSYSKLYKLGIIDVIEVEVVPSWVNAVPVPAPKIEQFGSGGYREYKTGKPSFMGIAPIGLERVAMRCTYGKEKYGDLSGFGKGKELPCASTMDSALRHINQYLQGDNSEDHLAAAVWNLLVVMQTEIESPEWNDIKAREGVPAYDYNTHSSKE